MKITYDPSKRATTFKVRGIDFDDAAEGFDGMTFDASDDRFDYGEVRTITVGHLRQRMVIIVCTGRGDARHVISMRKANDREQARYKKRFGEN